jgi:hypothetical protein
VAAGDTAPGANRLAARRTSHRETADESAAVIEKQPPHVRECAGTSLDENERLRFDPEVERFLRSVARELTTWVSQPGTVCPAVHLVCSRRRMQRGDV